MGENADEPFNRSKAINAAARKAARRVFVLADGDVIYDPSLLVEAIQTLSHAPWVIPFNRVRDITKEKTEELLRKDPCWPLPGLDERCTEGYMSEAFAGKINIFTREAFEKAGGFDERFVGWGGEDDAFLSAMKTFNGPFVRLNRTVYHCWHPHAGPDSNPHYQANLALLERYHHAHGNPEAMRHVIGKEFK
ncbi:galactosyltransferase-related protein [Paenibacillus sp.]|uniref:galactosyltransferase-related protein n=1 Tax=Paenibacillus sp. TaxID=58172 RepID=UPI002D4C08E5|nr:galactosyltransferase-related protein [Paenibacillus sp.]HZG87977.1 galactosyltransferase-related protein [Paenibacillus sp.]